VVEWFAESGTPPREALTEESARLCTMLGDARRLTIRTG
jgi:hypothetical protein